MYVFYNLPANYYETCLVEHHRTHFYLYFLIVASQVVFFSIFQAQLCVKIVPRFFPQRFPSYFGRLHETSFKEILKQSLQTTTAEDNQSMVESAWE